MIWKYDLKETVVMCSIRSAVEFPKIRTCVIFLILVKKRRWQSYFPKCLLESVTPSR